MYVKKRQKGFEFKSNVRETWRVILVSEAEIKKRHPKDYGYLFCASRSKNAEAFLNN